MCEDVWIVAINHRVSGAGRIFIVTHVEQPSRQQGRHSHHHHHHHAPHGPSFAVYLQFSFAEIPAG